MPEQVFLQNRNVVLEFPDGTPDDVIKKTIKREYPMTGEEVAGQMVVNPDWFNSEMTLDEYERYREWKSEQDMSVGDFAGVAATALGQVGGEVLKSLGQLATSPIDSISEVPTAFSLGTKDIWNLGKQIKGNLQKTSGTYAEFLDGRQDTASLRKSYRSKLAEDMKSEQEMIGYFSKERERIISESDNPDFVRGAANVLDPSVFFGGFLGKNFAKAASKAASGAAGKAASFTGSKIAGAGDIVAGVTDRAADALSTGFTRATGVTPETGKALAYGSGVGVGVASAGAPIVGGLYAGTKGAQVGGRVLAEAGEGLQRGIGREGFFGGAAARLEGKQGYGLARALSVADPVLEYGAQAAGGAVAGGALGMGLGALADGWDGAASGLGGGIALGGIGGGVARGIEGVTGVAMREKRARDVDAYLNNMQGEQRVLLENYIAKAGKDQAATILDVSKIFTGSLGDALVEFKYDPSDARGFVPDMKKAEGIPTLVVNLAKADSHVTIGHELWHGLTKMEQMQPMADQIRTELAGMWSDKKLVQEGLIPEAQLERYFNDYVKKLKPSEREAVMNTHGKDRESRAKYIVDEIAAEQMSVMITGKKGKQYDRMMRGFDTPLRNLIDETVLNGNKGIVTSLVGKLSNIGVTPGKSMLFPDMQAASPTVSAMMRDMIRTRKNLGELVEATDKTITTAIRKQDFSKHQVELEKLNMLKDDGKGGRVMKDDKDIAAEEQASDLALREVLAKGGPDGMRIEAKQDERGTIVGEEIRGSRFSPEQISEIQKNSTILPSVRQNVEAFNNAVENGLIIDMVYYAATRKTKSRLTGKYTSKYSSGIKRSKRDVLPYGLEITNAGNIVVRAIDWTKMWTDTANMSFAKKLGLWENDHKLFLNDFKQYLTNLSGDRKSSQSLFGKDKADFMQGVLMSSERGGSKYARTFRLDRMDGLSPTGEKAMMSEQAYQLSKQRFMPDDGTVRAEPDQTFKLGNEGVARFMPANDRVDLADYADRNVIALAADRMGIGVVKVGPTGAKRVLSIPAQGGRGFMYIFNGGGWAFSDQATASRFLKRLKEDADENGNAVVGITVQSQINHLKNQTGQLAYVEAMQAAIDAGAISKRAADSQVRAMSDAVLASEAASIKQTTKQKFRKIRNISGLERAVKNKALNFADMEPLLKQMQRKALPIKEAQLKEIGMTAPDIARDIADPELADIPFGSVVALLEVNVKQTPEKNNFHHSYPFTVHGNALGYLNRFHNIADLSTEPRIRNKHGVSAQPLQTVMPVMDNILKTIETKEGIPADPAARFMPDIPDLRPRGAAERRVYQDAASFKAKGKQPRNPELAVAAYRLFKGKISHEQFADIVDVLLPWDVIGGPPDVPSTDKIKKYLLPAKYDKRKKFNLSKRNIDGQTVEVRIDIPAWEKSTKHPNSDPTYVITLHEPVPDTATSVGETITYDGVAVVDNPTFVVRAISGQGGPIMIAMGKGKTPLATVKGSYKKLKPKELEALLPQLSDSSVWTEAGFNPLRSSDFTDVRTKQSVVGGDTAVMVGNRVFVKNAKLAPKPTGITGKRSNDMSPKSPDVADFRFQPDIGPAPQRADDGWIFPNGKFLGLGGLDHEGAFNSWANKNRNNSYANQVLGLKNDRVIKEDGHPDEPVRRKDVLKAGIVRVVREGDGVHRKIHAQGNMNRTQKAALERMAINSERSLSHDPSLEQHGEGLFYGRSSKLIYETPKKLRFNKERESMRQEMVDAGLIRFQPDIGGQDSLGMFSAAERATVDLKQERGSASQMLAMIKKAGVKDEEIAELGLDKFLEGNRKVSKEEIIDYLVDNQITVEETVLGEKSPLQLPDHSGWTADHGSGWTAMSPGRWIVYDENGAVMDSGVRAETEAHAITKAAQARADEMSAWKPPKHASYVEPGADEGSYRELLLRLPESKYIGVADYTGGHYGEYPNVLAHVRFNDRTSEYGKTLFLEEMQSDWHQEGRKKGYVISETEKARLKLQLEKLKDESAALYFSHRKERSNLVDEMGWEEAQASGFGSTGWRSRHVREKIEMERRIDEAQAAYQKAFVSNRIPDAPFKTSWHELSMKRMISYAAKNGYDAIAWTKGETQAARYDLSKQVDSISYHESSPGAFDIVVFKDSSAVINKKAQSAADLENLVGKEVAKRIVDDAGVNGELSGLDLKVGGEGMAGFYDRMLPKMKTWKKLGLKVESGDLGGEPGNYDNVNAHIVKLTPEVKAKVLDTGIARFMPDASVPGAEKNSIGWSMILSKAGKWRVYDPSGALAGIASSKAVAERIFRTKYKRELRKTSKADSVRFMPDSSSYEVTLPDGSIETFKSSRAEPIRYAGLMRVTRGGKTYPWHISSKHSSDRDTAAKYLASEKARMEGLSGDQKIETKLVEVGQPLAGAKGSMQAKVKYKFSHHLVRKIEDALPDLFSGDGIATRPARRGMRFSSAGGTVTFRNAEVARQFAETISRLSDGADESGFGYHANKIMDLAK